MLSCFYNMCIVYYCSHSVRIVYYVTFMYSNALCIIYMYGYMYVLLSIVWHTQAVIATCNGKQCMKYTHAAASLPNWS